MNLSLKKLPGNTKEIVHSFLFPVFITAVIWMVKFAEYFLETSFAEYGVYPHTLSGLKGVILAPLIHGSFNHIFDNTVPLLALCTAIFYFYRRVAYQVFFLIYLISGLWVWLIAAPGFYHIGASGVVYGLSAFIFFSGVIRHDIRLLTVFLIIIFMYGGMIWGIFPTKESISWESHLMGALSGMLIAVIYRKHGPPKIIYDWLGEDDDDDEENEDIDTDDETESGSKTNKALKQGEYSDNDATYNEITVNYSYRKKPPENGTDLPK